MSIFGAILGITISAAFLFMIYRLIGIPNKKKDVIEKKPPVSGTVSRSAKKPDVDQ